MVWRNVVHIYQRVRVIRENKKLDRREFSAICEIKTKTIENIENGIQKINGEHIERIVQEFPQYSYWLVTGGTIPEKGQISPITSEEEKRRIGARTGNKKGGRDIAKRMRIHTEMKRRRKKAVKQTS